MRNKLLSVVGLLLTGLLCSPANATFTASAGIQIGGVFAPGFLCSTGNQSPAAEGDFAGTLTPNQGGASLQAVARGGGDAAGLHAYASVTTGPSKFNPTTYEAASDVTVNLFDAFHFNAIGAAIVSMTITTDGSVSGNKFTFGLTDFSLSGNTGNECVVNNAGSCVVQVMFDLSQGFDLFAQLIAQADVQVAGTAVADFSETAFISSLLFTDLAGNPLNLSYTTDSGLHYPMSQGSAPEPGSFALSLLGLACLAMRTWRRTVRSQG